MNVELFAPPATVLAGHVTRLIAASDPDVAAHSARSYQFAAGFAASDGADVDHEVLYVGTILHDIGLSSIVGGSSERFDVRGANLVRQLALDHGIGSDRAANIWDVIAMHASSALARHKSPETRYSNSGISLDIRGESAQALPSEFVRAVLDRWPRRGFPAAFGAALADEVRTHPDSARMSFLESVAVAHVDGFSPTDFLAVLRMSEGFV